MTGDTTVFFDAELLLLFTASNVDARRRRASVHIAFALDWENRREFGLASSVRRRLSATALTIRYLRWRVLRILPQTVLGWLPDAERFAQKSAFNIDCDLRRRVLFCAALARPTRSDARGASEQVRQASY